MPATNVQSSAPLQERLDQLIRLKRGERPRDAFWKEFEQGIRSKQLSSLVIYQPWYLRAGRTALIVSRKAAPGTAAAGVLAIAVAAVTQSGFFASQQQQPLPAEIAQAEPVAPLFAMAQEEMTMEQPAYVPETPRPSEPSAIYRVPVMARSQAATGYELRYAPQTLTTGGAHSDASTPMGAKVISATREF